MPLIEDGRSKKVAFVAHCLLNQNAKVNGFVKVPAGYSKLVKYLFDKGYGIAQLPCPETACLGLHRWWHVREQYDGAGYREFCRRILQPTIFMMKEFYKEGFKIVVIGVDGSPSCGVNFSGTSKEWGGEPSLKPGMEYPIKEGMAPYMEELLNEAKKAGIKDLKMIGLKIDYPEFDEEKAIQELEKEL